jgi:thiamine biosynthesis lipoprotein ApbE
LLSAVVWDLAMEGDALSTALLVLGRNGIEKLSNLYPAAGFLVVSSVDSKVSFASAGDVFDGLGLNGDERP